jgi:hypothetical protein
MDSSCVCGIIAPGVIDELFEDPLKVLLVENQQPVETL